MIENEICMVPLIEDGKVLKEQFHIENANYAATIPNLVA
jgi:hypothetical protein